MKLSQKKQLLIEKNALSDILETMLEEMGEGRITQFMTSKLDERLEEIEGEIENEQTYADENRSGAYKSQGTEARKMVKYLKTVKKKQLQVMKLFQDFLKMKEKVDKL